jgi:hypothetical protein
MLMPDVRSAARRMHIGGIENDTID